MRRAVALLVVLALLAPTPSWSNPRSAELRRLGFSYAYNLDHDKALAAFKEAVAADPEDPGAYRAMAAIAWLTLLYQRGSLSVDDYLGSATQANVKLKSPPPDLAAQFRTNADKALQLAEARLRQHPNDIGARYDVGAAVGQIAAYTATVDGKIVGGFSAARRAFDEHERVLEADPSRKDAGLITGTYRYIVANLNFMMRWMAYIVGFGGGRERAIQMLESCAGYTSDVQTEARAALVLIYNRERRYDDALRLLELLRTEFPRNRLLWLEAGATQLRAGRFTEAQALLDAGIAMFEKDPRPKAFGEPGLWYLKRGSARVGAGMREQAASDLKLAFTLEARDWVRGRAQTELGKLQDLAGNRAEARRAYTKAAAICRQDLDPLGAEEADRLLKRPYTGTNPAGRRQ